MMEMVADIIVSATITMIFVFLKITTLCKSGNETQDLQ